MSAAGEAAYGAGVQKGILQQQQTDPGVLPYGVAVYKKSPAHDAYQPPAGGNAAPAPFYSPASADPHKRKSGRPRKYDTDVPVPLAVVLPSPPAAVAPVGSSAAPTVPPGFSPGTEGGGVASPQAPPPPPPSSESAPAKKRGRPLGSSNKKPRRQQQQPQVAAPGSGWAGLKPHIFTVQAGEDVVSRAMSFSCNGWAVCILTANGAVSNVTLRQGDSAGGTVTYEGRFEILSLAGSYLLSGSAGLSSRTGGLSVSLAGPDGRVLGGAVAGPLTAVSPVQVVIGSFLADAKKEHDSGSVPGKFVSSGFQPASSPTLRGTMSESSGGHGSLPNTIGPFNTSNQQCYPNFPSWK